MYTPVVDDALAFWIIATTLAGTPLDIKVALSTGRHAAAKVLHGGQSPPLPLETGGPCEGEAAKSLLPAD